MRARARAASWYALWSCPRIRFRAQHPARALELIDVGGAQEDTHIDMVATLLGDVRDGATSAGVKHDLMLVHERILEHGAEDVSARDMISNLAEMNIGLDGNDASLTLISVGVKSQESDRSRTSVLIPLGM